MRHSILRLACGVTATVLSAATVHAAADPAVTCQRVKTIAAGKYALCLHKAAALLIKTGDSSKYDLAITKCDGKLQASWTKSETRAGAGICVDTTDVTEMSAFTDACASAVDDALGGATLPLDVATCNSDLATCQSGLTAAEACGDGSIDPGEDCDFGDLGGATCVTLGYSYGLLRCGAGCVYDTSSCDTTAKLVFVTSTVHNANLGGLAGADGICQSLASGAGLEGTWVAWLSTASPEVLALDRIADEEYRLVDRVTVVASNKTNFLAGGLDHAIDMTEDGTVISNSYVFTGTDQDLLPLRTCSDWTSAADVPVSAAVGATSSSGLEWTYDHDDNCASELRLYCFQQ